MSCQLLPTTRSRKKTWGLFWVRGEHAEALPHFTEAVRIKSNYFDALENLGLALREQGKAAEAVGFFERADKGETGLRQKALAARPNLGRSREE